MAGPTKANGNIVIVRNPPRSVVSGLKFCVPRCFNDDKQLLRKNRLYAISRKDFRDAMLGPEIVLKVFLLAEKSKSS